MSLITWNLDDQGRDDFGGGEQASSAKNFHGVVLCEYLRCPLGCALSGHHTDKGDHACCRKK